MLPCLTSGSGATECWAGQAKARHKKRQILNHITSLIKGCINFVKLQMYLHTKSERSKFTSERRDSVGKLAWRISRIHDVNFRESKLHVHQERNIGEEVRYPLPRGWVAGSSLLVVCGLGPGRPLWLVTATRFYSLTPFRPCLVLVF
jgi:hypothetical protein